MNSLKQTLNSTNLLKSTKNFSNVMSKKSKNKSDKKQKTEPEPEQSPITVDKSNNVLISIVAKPGAKQNAITGITAEGVAVQINAPPSDGEANTELVKYLASVLNLRKSDVLLERGFKSRNKCIKITEKLSADEVRRMLQQEID